MLHKKDDDIKGSWLTSRGDIKLLDCTIRDGGLINSHFFDDKFVKNIYQTCVDAGVDYMEVGYKASKKIFNKNESGKWKFCDEEDIRKIVDDNPTPLKITVMADAGRTDYHEDILPFDQSVIDCVRVATYIHQIPEALDIVKDCVDKGYETTINLMAVSVVHERDLDEALKIVAQSDVKAIYLVDSFGSFFPTQIRELTIDYVNAIKDSGKEIGIHAHNNQQLAYANTIESMIYGTSWLDATINGMGRGAGNCPLELLIGFLKNPKFKIRPVLDCVQKNFIPLQKDLEWGYQIPYFLTGQLNRHPREAIKIRSSDKADDYVAFYDSLMQEDS